MPVPGPNQLLIRTKAVAINPSDWKMQQTKKDMPCILGSDVAGTVEAIGPFQSDQSTFQKGNRVAAFAGGAWSGVLDQGGFQAFVVVSSSSTILLPANVSFESGATIPMAAATAASALWNTLGLPKPDIRGATEIKLHMQSESDPNFKLHRTGILVYGASTAVGLMTIQMARNLGLIVFAVASKKHKGYICSLGAHYFFAREEGDLVEAVTQAALEANLDEPLRLGLDAVSQPNSILNSVAILEGCCTMVSSTISHEFQRKTAKLAITLDWPQHIAQSHTVTVERTSASHFHINEENARWLFHSYLKEGLQEASVRPVPPIRIVGSGLESVQSALIMCEQGVSCQKLIVQV